MADPAKDPRLFIRVHENMPEHPKIEPLSDAAFRVLVSTWCWCARNRTDGFVSAVSWAKRGPRRARDELVGAGLAEPLPDGDIQMHDYGDWQRLSAEIDAAQERSQRGGSFGGHKRWHLAEGKRDPDCKWCRDL